VRRATAARPLIDRRPLPAGDGRGTTADGGARAPRERLGFQFLLLLAWVVFEFGRPPEPMKIPMLIAFVLLGGWLLRANKQWTLQGWCVIALLAEMAVNVPLAVNTYTAFWTTYFMAVTLLCVCLPLQSLVTSIRRIRVWAYTFLAVAAYVGVWAITHDGFGPSGAKGAQDENYVAALMGMAIPFAYFSLFVEKRRIVRMLLMGSILVFVGATVVGFSRGGFLGLVAAVFYCLARSPRKLRGFVVVAIIGIVAVLFAGPGYWDEMQTISAVDQGTADLRIEIWKIGVRVWQGNPLLGVGPGNFPWVMNTYQSAEQTERFGRGIMAVAHSLYVELLTDFGIVGVALFGILLWQTRVHLRRIQRSGTARPGQGPVADNLVALRCYADAVAGGIIAILVNGVFLSLLYFAHLWLLIALAGALSHVSRAQGGASRTP